MVKRDLDAAGKIVASLTSNVAELEGQLEDARHQAVQLDTLRAYILAVETDLDAMDFPRRRAAVEAFGIRVVAQGRDDWRLEGNIPIMLDFRNVGDASQSPS